MLKRTVFIPILIIANTLALTGQVKQLSSDGQIFYLYYGYSGLGSELGSFQPTINIKGTNFVYTYEQNSYLFDRVERKDTICLKEFRQSSIDSVLEILKHLKDTSIFQSNPCIMSGGIHYMTVTNGTDSVYFTMKNTFDYTALKIANILNQYAPADKQLWANEQMIKDEEACWTRMRKGWDEEDKGKKKGKAKNK